MVTNELHTAITVKDKTVSSLAFTLIFNLSHCIKGGRQSTKCETKENETFQENHFNQIMKINKKTNEADIMRLLSVVQAVSA